MVQTANGLEQKSTLVEANPKDWRSMLGRMNRIPFHGVMASTTWKNVSSHGVKSGTDATALARGMA